MIYVTKPTANQFGYQFYQHMNIDVLIDNNIEQMVEKLNEVDDVIWFDWAHDVTAALSQYRFKAKTIVRVIDHEIYQGRVDRVKWYNIDAIWFVNEQARIDFFNRIKIDKPSFVIPCCIDEKQYPAKYTSEKVALFNTLFARPRKRIERAVKAMEIVNKHDAEWKLIIRVDPSGFSQEYNELVQLIHRSPANIELDLRKIPPNYMTQKEDLVQFYQQGRVILSTSDHETYHYAIAEGALCGCFPIVYRWEWGKPETLWSPFLVSSVEEMAAQILASPTNVIEPRKYIIDNYSPSVLIPKLLKECASL